jgi:ribosome-associated protein
MADESVLRVTPSLAIPLEELEWRFSASGGPGGQHANTSNTRAEVRFDVAHSPSLDDDVRATLLERFGPSIRIVASDQRSQAQNRELAMQRLSGRLASALTRPSPRRPTRPSLASQRRRLEWKRRRAALKRQRRDRGAGEID